MKFLYKRFGILNLFIINWSNGSYWLDLSVFEEWIVAKLFLELAKVEGIEKISYFHLNGKQVSKVTKEFIDKLDFKSGIIELTYICNKEDANQKLWEKLCKRYLNNPIQIDSVADE